MLQIRSLKIKAVLVIMALLAVTMLCTIGCRDTDQDKLVSLYEQSVTSTVQIIVDYQEENGSYYSESDTRFQGWTGSGVFIENDVILTAGHVLGACDPFKLLPKHVKVKLHDGTMLDVVDVYAEDYKYADVGILRVKVPANFKPHLPKFDTTQSVGEKLYAIGAPFGIFPTLTQGIVSQLDVKFMETASLLMQTDCALNPGNSGGPMFDMDGDLIGLCVAGMGAVRQSSGVNFCETISTCMLSLNKWKATRAVEAMFELPPVVEEEFTEVIEDGVDAGGPDISEIIEAIDEIKEEIEEIKEAVKPVDVIEDTVDEEQDIDIELPTPSGIAPR